MKQTAFGLSENASYKIVALLITLILWVIILGSKEAAVIKTVATEYLLPRDMVVTNNVPREVAFRVIGPRLALKKFSENSEPLTIDLTSAIEGLTTVRIHPDSINVPPGLRVTSVSPSIITPKLEKSITKSIPIQVTTTGKLPSGINVVSLKADPPQWQVSGTRASVEGTSVVKTTPLDLTNVRSSLTQELALVIDEPGIQKQKNAKVKVELIVK